jgi:hypothetical protein
VPPSVSLGADHDREIGEQRSDLVGTPDADQVENAHVELGAGQPQVRHPGDRADRAQLPRPLELRADPLAE